MAYLNKEIETMNPLELKKLQSQKLKGLIKYTYNNCKPYKKAMDRKGISPEDIQSPKDYEKIPILTKDEIRNNFKELTADNSKQRFRIISSTGGSTGNPIKVFHDGRMPIYALGWRVLEWWDI